MDGPFYLSSGKSASRFCLRVIGAVDNSDIAVRIFFISDASDKVSVHQTHFISREQPEIFLRRLFHKVFPLDIELAPERNFAAAKSFIFQVVRHIQVLHLVFRIVVDDKADRVEYRHHTRLLHLEVLADAVLEHGIICRTLGF